MSISYKKIIKGNIDDIIVNVTAALKEAGFGVLTRIDFHTKIKEKLNKDISPVIILGACNPSLAYEAYNMNSDVTGVLPCNVVLRDIGQGQVSVEMAKPSAMMKILNEPELVNLSIEADKLLEATLNSLN